MRLYSRTFQLQQLEGEDFPRASWHLKGQAEDALTGPSPEALSPYSRLPEMQTQPDKTPLEDLWGIYSDSFWNGAEQHRSKVLEFSVTRSIQEVSDLTVHAGQVPTPPSGQERPREEERL